MFISPTPVKVKVVPPLMVAGPLRTSNATVRPLEAVADRFTVSVIIWSPIAAKSIVWSALAITRVSEADPA